MKILAAAAVAAICAACSHTEDPAASKLAAARAKWGGHHVADYVVTWQRSCECIEDAVRRIEIHAQGGSIIDARFVDDQSVVGEPVRGGLSSIDGVFDRIQHALDDEADEVSVDYDPTWGFPGLVFIDYSRGQADEEFQLHLSSFAPISR